MKLKNKLIFSVVISTFFVLQQYTYCLDTLTFNKTLSRINFLLSNNLPNDSVLILANNIIEEYSEENNSIKYEIIALRQKGKYYLQNENIDSFLELTNQSLELSLQHEIQDESINNFINLAKYYYEIQNFNKVYEITKDAIENINPLKDKKNITKLINLNTEAFIVANKTEKAKTFYQTQLNKEKNYKNPQLILKFYDELGYIAFLQSDFIALLNNSNSLLQYAVNIKDTLFIAQAYNNIGTAYSYMGNLEATIDNYMLAKKYYEFKNYNLGLAKTMNNIAYAFSTQELFDKEIKAYKQALAYYNKEPESNATMLPILHNIAAASLKLNKLDDAKYHCDLGLSKAIEIEDYTHMVLFYTVNAQIAYKNKQLKLTKEYLTKGLQILDKVNIDEKCDFYFSYCQFMENNEKCLLKCLEFAEQSQNIIHLKNAHNLLSLHYKTVQNYKQSLWHNERYIVYKDSLVNKNNLVKVTEGNLQYAFDKQQLKDSLKIQTLSKQTLIKDLEINKNNKQKLLLGLSTVILLLFIFFLIYILRLRSNYNEKLQSLNGNLLNSNSRLEVLLTDIKSTNQQLTEANKNLENFAQIAAHDLKAPLRTIASFNNILRKKFISKIDEKDVELFDFISEGCNNLQEIITGLFKYSQVSKEMGKSSEVNLVSLINTIKTLLYNEINNANATITFDEYVTKVYGYNTLLKQLFLNLINNSIKYRKKNVKPKIEITSKIYNENFVIVQIKDNGIGIEEKFHKEVFEMFRKLHSESQYKGSGIGLATCKKIIDSHKGEIWIESVFGQGTTVNFTLPFNDRILVNKPI